MQGVRPAALQKVRSQELAEFIAVCIRPRNERPRARQLLKAPYFDSIRERCAVRCDAISATTSQVCGGTICPPPEQLQRCMVNGCQRCHASMPCAA